MMHRPGHMTGGAAHIRRVMVAFGFVEVILRPSKLALSRAPCSLELLLLATQVLHCPPQIREPLICKILCSAPSIGVEFFYMFLRLSFLILLFLGRIFNTASLLF